MIYQPKSNEDSDNIAYRYALEQKGSNTLFVIGLNPSKANSHNSDNTMRKIMRLAEYNGFNGYVMMNLYAERATFPKELDTTLNKQLHLNNLSKIIEQLREEKEPTILLCFGNNIHIRPYLQNCWDDICKRIEEITHPKWVCIGKTKKGYPKHPARLSTKLNFIPYD